MDMEDSSTKGGRLQHAYAPAAPEQGSTAAHVGMLPLPLNSHQIDDVTMQQINAALLQLPQAGQGGKNWLCQRDLTFEQATAHMLVDTRAAHAKAMKWAHSWAPEHFRDFARTRATRLQDFCRSLHWIADCVRRGRHRSQFPQWPIEVVVEMEELLSQIGGSLYRLSQYQGCEWLEREVMADVQAMGEDMVNLIRVKMAGDWRDG
ncbi:hypothetical protein LTR53_004596 [Teratosphaeriaceae sp. CCFEE 6253]|nr:hypothetical protein LTR53_004596 [Teratosphaeriaceae sp. CCFEE 6253]